MLRLRKKLRSFWETFSLEKIALLRPCEMPLRNQSKYGIIQKSVGNAEKRLFEISSTYCGIIIEKDEISSLGGNEDYIAQVQEDRLSRMLAQDLVEG